MKFNFRPDMLIYNLYAILVFISIMLLIAPFVLVGSFFGKISGGNFIYRVCAFWGDLWFLLIGIRHINRFESPHDRSRQYIFVANHISYLDAPVIVKTIRQPVRVLGKAEISKIPLFGFIYKNAIVTVDRQNPERRARSVRVLKSVIRKGISIFIFPEGTFNETGKPLKDFFDGAFRMAIETQTPIKPVLFLDSYNRMSYAFFPSLRPGRSRSVFLDEIPVEGLTMKELPMLRSRVFSYMEERLIHYNASWINEKTDRTAV